jgi:hypothetical protein
LVKNLDCEIANQKLIGMHLFFTDLKEGTVTREQRSYRLESEERRKTGWEPFQEQTASG